MVAVAGLAVIIPVEAGAQSEQPPSGPAEGVQGQPEVAARRGPADLCQELRAFVQGPEEERAAEDDSPPQAATAVEAPSQDKPAPQPEGGNDASQEASGMSGPIAPSGAGTPGPQVGAKDEPAGQDEAATPASHEAAAPTSAEAKQVPGPSAGTAAPPPTTDPSAAQVEKAQAAAQTGDIGQCRAVTQEMRRAGITMPPPLLALAALDPKFFGTGQQP
ncbi:MAG TPA: hypothetical protein VNS22_17930 [Geminicoccus sp.]|uniref:hypothetical protein n=1 Tax=Geminicoccus sp. TaxID=2024832 RepID=UPI002BC17D26|nr:hypothetical protein [Geminicoccus sp.]HWL70241.1 hypothetical protein [Geminicoccus sp.]